jgi:hypothetical protein
MSGGVITADKIKIIGITYFRCFLRRSLDNALIPILYLLFKKMQKKSIIFNLIYKKLKNQILKQIISVIRNLNDHFSSASTMNCAARLFCVRTSDWFGPDDIYCIGSFGLKPTITKCCAFES